MKVLTCENRYRTATFRCSGQVWPQTIVSIVLALAFLQLFETVSSVQYPKIFGDISGTYDLNLKTIDYYS